MRAQDLTCYNSNNNNNNNIYNSYFEQATLLDTSFFAITLRSKRHNFHVKKQKPEIIEIK